MFRKYALIYLAVTTLGFAQSGPGNPTIATGQYDTNRSAANLNELVLTPSNVKSSNNQFGKLFSWSVDGEVYAQPLYMPGVLIDGHPTNVVYVATMHNTIYAFNADVPGAGPLWQKNLGTPVKAPTANGCPSQNFTGVELGVLSTPVIDSATNTIYSVSASPSGSGYSHTIHALDLTTGQEKFNGPQAIQASASGNGYNSQNGSVTMGPASTEVQRTALLLANGQVYAAFGNCGPDVDPWHGWIIGYNSSNLQNQQTLFNTTPNGGQGGVWQSGRGLVADAAGDLYFATGNSTPTSYGSTPATTGSSSGDAAQQDYGMRLLQLTSAGQFQGSYPPPNYTALNTYDLDFSSSGPLLVPGTSLLVAGGKDGIIYVFDTRSFGNPIQTFQGAGDSACNYGSDACDQIHDIAFWNNNLYVWGSHDVLRSFRLTNGKFNTTASSRNTISVNYRPAALAVSANSTQSGILWATTPDSILHAFDATNVATELWNSKMNPDRDALPSFTRFAEPTVANGHVYVATRSKQVVAYGLLSDFSLSTSTTSQNVYQGSSTSFTVTAAAISNTNPAITLSASGLPTGTTATFNPTVINGSGSSTVTITTSGSTPTGVANVIIQGVAGSANKSVSVALNVTTPDTAPPTATCCTYSVSGSSYVMNFTAQDTGSGIASIVAVQSVNSTTNVPAFTPGTKDVINFTANESGWGSYVQFKITDVAGNSILIDPVTYEASRYAGQPQPYVLKGITAECGVLSIHNGPQGLKNLQIRVNNGLIQTKYQIAGMKDNESRYVPLLDSIPVGATVSVEITPLGKPGGTAVLIFGPTQTPLAP